MNHSGTYALLLVMLSLNIKKNPCDRDMITEYLVITLINISHNL